MKIVCNGENKEVDQGTTLEQFIASLNLAPDSVVAEVDGAIIKREEYATFRLCEEAKVELIRFVGGG